MPRPSRPGTRSPSARAAATGPSTPATVTTGGLQFSASTWRAYGGGAYASTASGASKAAQISVAERVLASQGPGARPVCGPEAGLSRGGPAAVADTSSGAGTGSVGSSGSAFPASSGGGGHREPVSRPTGPSRSTPAVPSRHGGWGRYTVKPGDTLSKIAAAQRLLGGRQELYRENRSVVGGDPDLIHPGQHLVLR